MRVVNVAEVPAVAPVAVAAGEGAASLFTLLLWGIALSLLLIWRHTLGALFQFVADEMDKVAVSIFGRTRHLLGPVSAALRAADDAIQTALSTTAKGAEHATVYLYNHAWQTLEWTAREIWKLGYATGAAIQGLVSHTIPSLVSVGTHAVSVQVHGLGRREAALELRVEHGVARKLGAAEATLEHDFGIARRGIDAVEKETRLLARKAEAQAARLSRVEKLLGVGVFAAVLVKALERIGLKWLRCPALGNIGRKTGCRGFKFLEDLLFGVIDVLVVTDLCRITGLMVDVAESSAVKGALHEFIRGFEDLVQCRGWKEQPRFVVREVALPDRIAFSALPELEPELPLAA